MSLPHAASTGIQQVEGSSLPTRNTRSRTVPVIGAAIAVLWIATQLVADRSSSGIRILSVTPPERSRSSWTISRRRSPPSSGAPYRRAARVLRRGGSPQPGRLGDGQRVTRGRGGARHCADHRRPGQFRHPLCSQARRRPGKDHARVRLAVRWRRLSVGSSVFLLATGIGALRVQALPRWLARLTIGSASCACSAPQPSLSGWRPALVRRGRAHSGDPPLSSERSPASPQELATARSEI